MSRVVQYGTQCIEYSITVANIKNHYVEVSEEDGVVLKGPTVSALEADRLVLKRACWILEKLQTVSKGMDVLSSDIVTGSRLIYLGKRYFVELERTTALRNLVDVYFKYNRFHIRVGKANENYQDDVLKGLDKFYLAKAKEKLPARIKKWQQITELKPLNSSFKHLSKRWGSCSEDDELSFNCEMVKLPYRLIDYIIVHELCHVVYKNHGREFWQLLRKFMPDYKERHAMLDEMKL